MPGEHTARPPPALHAPRPPAYNRTQQLSSTLRPTLAEETKREVEHSATTAAETKREAERERDGWISLRTQRSLLADSIKEMMQPCLIHLHVVSLVLLHPSSSTKEMMQPCLIHLHVIKEMDGFRCFARTRLLRPAAVPSALRRQTAAASPQGKVFRVLSHKRQSNTRSEGKGSVFRCIAARKGRATNGSRTHAAKAKAVS